MTLPPDALLLRELSSAKCGLNRQMQSKTDGRKLDFVTQTHSRRTVVQAVRRGMSQTRASGLHADKDLTRTDRLQVL